MVRLVFRPYTQIWRSICTSEPLRASTRVSSGFTLLRYSSQSFGSQQMRLHSNLFSKVKVGRSCETTNSHFHCAHKRYVHVLAHMRGLLGPCFKTGRFKSERQHSSTHVPHNCIYVGNTDILWYSSQETIFGSSRAKPRKIYNKNLLYIRLQKLKSKCFQKTDSCRTTFQDSRQQVGGMLLISLKHSQAPY